MSSGCGDVLTLEDLQIAKKHQLFEAEVITGKSGGVSTGTDIDHATNAVTGQVQKTMPAILRDVGFEPTAFDFYTGGTLSVTDRNKAVLWPLGSGGDGAWYNWEGALPKVVPAASTPATTGGIAAGAWKLTMDPTLRSDLTNVESDLAELNSDFEAYKTSLASANSGLLVDDSNIKVQGDFNNTVIRTQHSKNNDTPTVKDFGAIGNGVTDDTAALHAAFASGVYYFPHGLYKTTTASTISQLAKSDGPGVITFNGVNFPASRTVDNAVYLVSVPEMFPTIQAALDFFSFKRAANNAWFRIQVDNGVYRVKNIRSRVKDWHALQIIGNESNPLDCQLQVDTTDNGCGFIFEDGFGAAVINGFHIFGVGGWSSKGVWANQSYGAAIRVIGSGSKVTTGTAIRTERIYYGFQALYGGTINCQGTTAVQAGDCGYHAYAATINAYGCTAQDCAHTNGENLGFGFCAEVGGFINCERSHALGNQVAGFYALSNGSMWAHACVSNNNIGHGFYALNGGVVEGNGLSTADADRSNAYSNGGWGFYAVNGGIMQAWNSYSTNNSQGTYGTSNGGIMLT